MLRSIGLAVPATILLAASAFALEVVPRGPSGDDGIVLRDPAPVIRPAAPAAPDPAPRACFVNDPTGTPLNVRARINRDVIGTIANGTRVVILETSFDAKRRPWYLVSVNGQRAGWVFGPYIAC